MHILHINTERTWRGGEQQTLYLLRSLKARHINCHLVCQPGSPMAAKATEAGVDVIPIAMHGEADLVAGMRLNKLMRTHNYDIVHSHTSHAHALAYMGSVGCKTCRLVTRRVDFSIFRSRFLQLNSIKYRFMADYYVAISQKIKEVMVADGIAADRIFVVHSGIDLVFRGCGRFSDCRISPAIRPAGGHQRCPSGRAQRPAVSGSRNSLCPEGNLRCALFYHW